MDSTALGTRIKSYEKVNTSRKGIKGLPLMIRLDGKKFSNFTRGMKRPYDEDFRNLMSETTKFLVSETNALVGFHQSDEITLLLYNDKLNGEVYFDAKFHKIDSILASKASVYLNSILSKYFPDKVNLNPIFDCRSFNVPTKDEAVNTILWRELDATKNSVSMLAQCNFSHKQLHKKHTGEMLIMLEEKGIKWCEYPARFKRGEYIFRAKEFTKFSTEELSRLPSKHDAHKNPELMIERSVIKSVILPVLTKITNRVDVLFNGKQPETNTL